MQGHRRPRMEKVRQSGPDSFRAPRAALGGAAALPAHSSRGQGEIRGGQGDPTPAEMEVQGSGGSIPGSGSISLITHSKQLGFPIPRAAGIG